MTEDFLDTLDICSIFQKQSSTGMSQIVRRYTLKTVSPHKSGDFSCGSIRIAGEIRAVTIFKKIHGFDNLVWIPPDNALPHEEEFGLHAIHNGDRANAARGLGFCDNRSAFLGIGDVTRDMKRVVLKIKVLSLKPQAFATSYAGGRHQKHHTPILWLAVLKGLEEDFCLLLGEGIDGPLYGSGSIHFFDGILFYEFLSLGIVENNAENVIVMLDAFLAKLLAVWCPVFISEILKVSHDIDRRDVLESLSSQLGKGYPHHKAVHRNRRWAKTTGDNLERKPHLFCKIAEGFFFWNDFFRGRWLCGGWRHGEGPLLDRGNAAFKLLFPTIGFGFCQFLFFGCC